MLALPCTMCNSEGTIEAEEGYYPKYSAGSTGQVVRDCPRCNGTKMMPRPVLVSELFNLMRVVPKSTKLDEMFHQEDPDVAWNKRPFIDTGETPF